MDIGLRIQGSYECKFKEVVEGSDQQAAKGWYILGQLGLLSLLWLPIWWLERLSWLALENEQLVFMQPRKLATAYSWLYNAGTVETNELACLKKIILTLARKGCSFKNVCVCVWRGRFSWLDSNIWDHGSLQCLFIFVSDILSMHIATWYASMYSIAYQTNNWNTCYTSKMSGQDVCSGRLGILHGLLVWGSGLNYLCVPLCNLCQLRSIHPLSVVVDGYLSVLSTSRGLGSKAAIIFPTETLLEWV